MKTQVLKINPANIDTAEIRKAAQIIKKGDLVAFPTETVYGLGADALNAEAVAKIFAAKNRPLDDPLIVHIADKQDIFRVTKEIYKITLDLIDKFWPGPLTLVLKKSEIIPEIVTAGLDTVAVRMPNHPVALSFIKESQTPIAAPSANLFGRPSPTTAEHVIDDLDGRIDVILDGGLSSIGVESTVLDLTQRPLRILRPGGISIEELRRFNRSIKIFKSDSQPRLSPGMYRRHYSPKAKLILIEGNGSAQIDKIKELASEFKMQGYSFGIMVKEENKDRYPDFNVKSLGPGNDLTICAANLFLILRDFDREGVDTIIAEGVKEEGLGLAIMDRLRKAAGREDYV